MGIRSLNDKLTWWGNRPRWLYHLTKPLIAVPIIGLLLLVGLSPLWALTYVTLVHGYAHFFSEKAYDRFNLKDTVFDTVVTSIVVLPVFCAWWLFLPIILIYVALMELEWNSP